MRAIPLLLIGLLVAVVVPCFASLEMGIRAVDDGTGKMIVEVELDTDNPPVIANTPMDVDAFLRTQIPGFQAAVRATPVLGQGCIYVPMIIYRIDNETSIWLFVMGTNCQYFFAWMDVEDGVWPTGWYDKDANQFWLAYMDTQGIYTERFEFDEEEGLQRIDNHPVCVREFISVCEYCDPCCPTAADGPAISGGGEYIGVAWHELDAHANSHSYFQRLNRISAELVGARCRAFDGFGIGVPGQGIVYPFQSVNPTIAGYEDGQFTFEWEQWDTDNPEDKVIRHSVIPKDPDLFWIDFEEWAKLQDGIDITHWFETTAEFDQFLSGIRSDETWQKRISDDGYCAGHPDVIVENGITFSVWHQKPHGHNDQWYEAYGDAFIYDPENSHPIRLSDYWGTEPWPEYQPDNGVSWFPTLAYIDLGWFSDLQGEPQTQLVVTWVDERDLYEGKQEGRRNIWGEFACTELIYAACNSDEKDIVGVHVGSGHDFCVIGSQAEEYFGPEVAVIYDQNGIRSPWLDVKYNVTGDMPAVRNYSNYREPFQGICVCLAYGDETMRYPAFPDPVSGKWRVSLVVPQLPPDTSYYVWGWCKTEDGEEETPRQRLTIGTMANEEPAAIPTGFVLHQNYPNPFNAATKIRYSILTEAAVTLTIYNVAGQEVATLIKHHVASPGEYAIRWDMAEQPSGIYFYRLEAGDFVQTKKMVLISSR